MDHQDASVLVGRASIRSAARIGFLVSDNLNIETLGLDIPAFVELRYVNA